jgi:hypothetical protein
MGEPPLPTIEPVPADVPINLPFDLSWQGVLVVALVLLVIICFYLALRDPDPLRTDLDPKPVLPPLPGDNVRELPLRVGYRATEECRPIPIPPAPTKRGRAAAWGSLPDEPTVKIGRHRVPELPRFIRSHRRPAPRWLRRVGAATGLAAICATAVVVGVVMVYLLEG